jgi:hypothetical protein
MLHSSQCGGRYSLGSLPLCLRPCTERGLLRLMQKTWCGCARLLLYLLLSGTSRDSLDRRRRTVSSVRLRFLSINVLSASFAFLIGDDHDLHEA